jgi:hypothetical protein
MSSARRSSAAATLLLGLAVGGTVGYLVADTRSQEPTSTLTNDSASLAEIRAELDELGAKISGVSVDDQLAQLQTAVADILSRGDEISLRADFARTADRLEGHKADDFALRDADEDGTPDLEHLRQSLADIVSGKTPVARAKKADSADNAEFLGNLPLTDFALADHAHANLSGNVQLDDNLRVNGGLTISRNVTASADIEVFGDVVAAGGFQPGSFDAAPRPALAGMIRYNRHTGGLEYCDGTQWNEIAVSPEP